MSPAARAVRRPFGSRRSGSMWPKSMTKAVVSFLMARFCCVDRDASGCSSLSRRSRPYWSGRRPQPQMGTGWDTTTPYRLSGSPKPVMVHRQVHSSERSKT